MDPEVELLLYFLLQTLLGSLAILDNMLVIFQYEISPETPLEFGNGRVEGFL
jgi:hypothetical protein